MRPLRVIARMMENVVYSGDGMHLDGPLAGASFMRRPPEEREALPPVHLVGHVVDEDLPLARVVVDPSSPTGWVWACSAVHAEWLLHTSIEVRKRPPEAEYTRYTKSPSFHRGLGHTKAWDLRFQARFARELVWYAVGELAAVQSLLDGVVSLGKKVNHGHGCVASWSVEAWDHDWSVEREGELTRRMPASYRPKQVPGRASLRAPYHHRCRIGPCVEPDYEGLLP